MDKDRARKEIERIFEQYSGFIVEFEDWTDTGEDDLLVTVTTHQEHKSELYLTDGEPGTYLYIGEDVIEPLTEATVLRVMFFQAAQEVERLRAEVKRREDDMLRLSELNGELASMLRIARENAVHQQRAINRYEAERAEAKEEYPEHLCDCGMGDATRRGLHDKTCAVHRG